VHTADFRRCELAMTFRLVRIGWPNTVVVLALLLTPLVAMAAESKQRRTSAEPLLVEALANCLGPAERLNTLVADVVIPPQ
jgi:hypothetical protein